MTRLYQPEARDEDAEIVEIEQYYAARKKATRIGWLFVVLAVLWLLVWIVEVW